jgi:tetratricopeptide (TPR) repeat protein
LIWRRWSARAAWALALAVLTVDVGTAQVRDPDASPLLLEFPRSRPGPVARRVPPLDPELQSRLNHARMLREAGDFVTARDTLNRLLAVAPHHPLLVVELGRVLQDRESWRALEQLAKAERAHARDSVLLAPELAYAYERLERPREAVQVALEAWIAEPALGDWAVPVLHHMAGIEPKSTREALRRAADARPRRADLARAAARVEWRLGDGPGALKLLKLADRGAPVTPARWVFAEELLALASARDTLGAIEALLDLAADGSRDASLRLPAARRAWLAYGRRRAEAEGAPRVARALRDIPVEQWGDDLAIPVVRGLRHAGLTGEARTLMKGLDGANPELNLEKALNELRDGPSDRALSALASAAHASPEAAFRYAEALFFAGQPDSALAWFQRVATDSRGSWTGAALERIYLLEDAEPRTALPLFGRLAFEEWRGERKKAAALADSLYRSLPRGPLWAQAALALAAQREAMGDGKEALEPLLAVADGVPGDRLAPLARQRAGDVLRVWYKDDARALAQYEECLARYPKAWNAPEVRRQVESLRRDRRF